MCETRGHKESRCQPATENCASWHIRGSAKRIAARVFFLPQENSPTIFPDYSKFANNFCPRMIFIESSAILADVFAVAKKERCVQPGKLQECPMNKPVTIFALFDVMLFWGQTGGMERILEHNHLKNGIPYKTLHTVIDRTD
jgi:hypothetical protein